MRGLFHLSILLRYIKTLYLGIISIVDIISYDLMLLYFLPIHYFYSIYPKHSIYGIFTYIYHKFKPSVGKYTIHWVFGYLIVCAVPLLPPPWPLQRCCHAVETRQSLAPPLVASVTAPAPWRHVLGPLGVDQAYQETPLTLRSWRPVSRPPKPPGFWHPKES